MRKLTIHFGNRTPIKRQGKLPLTQHNITPLLYGYTCMAYTGTCRWTGCGVYFPSLGSLSSFIKKEPGDKERGYQAIRKQNGGRFGVKIDFTLSAMWSLKSLTFMRITVIDPNFDEKPV